MCSAPLTVSGGVLMEKTAPPGSLEPRAVESNLYYARLFPPARPRVLDALKRRLERHRAGLRAGREGRRGSAGGIMRGGSAGIQRFTKREHKLPPPIGPGPAQTG